MLLHPVSYFTCAFSVSSKGMLYVDVSAKQAK